MRTQGWGRDGQSWSVGAEVIAGDTSQQAVWEMLHTVIQQECPRQRWKPAGVAWHRFRVSAAEVYDFCARYAQPPMDQRA